MITAPCDCGITIRASIVFLFSQTVLQYLDQPNRDLGPTDPVPRESVLITLPSGAHTLELQFLFITCSQRLCLNRNISPTHYEVSKNIDFFAPEHNTTDPPYTKFYMHFVEKDNLLIIMSKVVLLEYLSNNSTQDEFRNFNKRRETPFNSAMEGLGLNYRFKCIVDSPAHTSLSLF